MEGKQQHPYEAAWDEVHRLWAVLSRTYGPLAVRRAAWQLGDALEVLAAEAKRLDADRRERV